MMNKVIEMDSFAAFNMFGEYAKSFKKLLTLYRVKIVTNENETLYLRYRGYENINYFVT
jgi:hypothetical protein